MSLKLFVTWGEVGEVFDRRRQQEIFLNFYARDKWIARTRSILFFAWTSLKNLISEGGELRAQRNFQRESVLVFWELLRHLGGERIQSNEMSQRLVNTTRMRFALWLLLTLLALTIAPISGCNEVIRARYCNNSLSCQRCNAKMELNQIKKNKSKPVIE